MREYSYHATDDSIEALRRLKAPWSAAARSEKRVVVTTAEGDVVRLSVERTDVEPALEAMRLRADLLPAADGAEEGQPMETDGLGRGRNDVVLFNGESWIEPTDTSSPEGDGAGPPRTIQLTGRAGQRPPNAVAVCTTTDAVVIAAGTGEGILIRIGVRPLTLDVVRDRVAIAQFLLQRGYTAD